MFYLMDTLKKHAQRLPDIVSNTRALQPSAQELNQLLQLQRDLLEKITLDRPLCALLDQLCKSVEQLIPNSRVAVMLLDQGTGYLNIVSAPGIPDTFHAQINRLTPGPFSRSAGSAVYSDQPVFCADTHTSPLWAEAQHLAQELNIRACWSYPLHNSDRHTAGSISVAIPTAGSPTPYQARVLESAAYIASIAISLYLNRLSLKDSEQQLRHIAASVPGVVFQLHFDHPLPAFSYVSEGISTLCGLSVNEVLLNSRALWRHIHRDDRQAVIHLFQQPTTARTPWHLECRILNQTGDDRWVLLSATPEWDEGQLKRLNGMLLDISREKESAARLELAGIAFASTSEGILVADQHNHIIEANRAYCEITGYTHQELVGKQPHMLAPGRYEKQDLETIYSTVRKTGAWQGELWNRRKNGAIYPQWLNINAVYDQNNVLSHYVHVIADVSNVKESEAKLRYMSQHDTLTDLPNRQLFRILLEHALSGAPEQPLAVLMIDLDRFKFVNETLGHQAGDQLLLLVTERLQGALSDDVLLARVGGDEFAVMLSNCQHPGIAEQMAIVLQAALEPPLDLNGQNFFTTASIGISLYPNHGCDSDTLLKNADTAVHQAKEHGRNHAALYHPERTEMIAQWVRLEPEIRNALHHHQFVLHYQPQWDSRSSTVTGVEALLRWQHPEEGLISPALFLPIVEEIGLMKAVGNWVLEQACAQAALWARKGIPLRVAVNIAGQQLISDDFVDYVTALLQKYQLPADLLEFEIVETIAMQHADAARPVLETLRNLGIRLALDDFGTGYSSLSYLKMLPVQKLKIDQSLIRETPHAPQDTAITRAVIALGHSLEMTVCAEGVESHEQRNFLAREGCDQLQGFLLSRPLTVQALDQWRKTL